MNITREVVTTVIMDDGNELKSGDLVEFVLKDGLVCIGIFQKVTKRGSLEFARKVGEDIYKFAVMPSSITEMEKWDD